MNFLLDTNILSEGTRPQPDARAGAWLNARPALTLFVSIVSIAEIRKGILLLPEGKKKTKLGGWLESELLPAFANRVIPLGEAEMNEWAALQADAEKKGHRLPVVDSLIAATARCHGLTLATRNSHDFRHCGIPVHNPWAE
ncbi:MAG: type II toxin-antitoxin system VapC family toxin [Verrucomicrobia bacterium]|nr:type II toxin-antitoxin system VapC family toxin [Verrucomicrobiota bacterium]